MTEIRIHLSEIAEWTEGNLSAGIFAGMVSNARTETGIHITSIATPESGWPMMAYCEICKTSTLWLNLYAAKPKDGDYFKIIKTCVDEVHGCHHTMQMSLPDNFFIKGPSK